MKPQPRTITGVAVNLGGRAQVAQLEAAIKQHRPDFVVAVEAYRAGKFLREMARRHGYRLRQAGRKHGAEAPGIAVLVRRGVGIRWDRLMKMTGRWFGPFTGRRRSARVYRKMTLRKGRTNFPLYFGHFPPGGPKGGARIGGRNRNAWQESATKAVRWLRRRKRGALVGDLNGTAAEIRQHIAGPAGARMDSFGKVSHAVVRGDQVTARRIDPPKGLHGWGLVTIRRKP